jgi:hypothetical protein
MGNPNSVWSNSVSTCEQASDSEYRITACELCTKYKLFTEGHACVITRALPDIASNASGIEGDQNEARISEEEAVSTRRKQLTKLRAS